MNTEHPDISRFFGASLRLQHLRVMVALAEHGLVSKAAQALHLTQSAVSKQLIDIEHAMGVAVVTRQRNRLHLTELGKRLAAHAQTVLNQLQRAELELIALSRGLSGQVRIGCVTSLAPTLLAQAMVLFKEAAPNVSLAVVEGHFLSLQPLMNKGEIDLILARIWQPQELPDIEQQGLTAEPIVAVCSRDHPLARQRDLSWADAQTWPWVLPQSGSVARRAIEAFWVDQGLSVPSDVIEAQSLQLNLALIRHMPRLCLMPESLAMSQAARGELAILNLQLGDVLAQARCYWRQGLFAQNEAARVFVDCLVAASAAEA
jgi:DNA-binding transcriptional LysR family regulator